MEYLNFVNANKWISFWLLVLMIGLTAIVLDVFRDLANRVLSLLAVSIRGWPPAHLDIYGRFAPQPYIPQKSDMELLTDLQKHRIPMPRGQNPVVVKQHTNEPNEPKNGRPG